MKYEKQLKQIPEAQRVDAFQYMAASPKDRESTDFSAGLTPSKCAQMIQSANTGDIKDQSLLSEQLEERSLTIGAALSTRRNAVLSTDWEIVPADNSEKAVEIADALRAELQNAGSSIDNYDSFYTMISGLLDAVMAGFSATEIIWKEAGKGIDGFVKIPTTAITYKDSISPLIITDDSPAGIPLPQNKVIFMKMNRSGGNPYRGGLVRPLAWIYTFSSINLKYLLGFTEKYGMPFVLAEISDKQFQTELTKIQNIVSNFAANGGAVVTTGTKITPVQASQTGGDVYFRFIEYCDKMIERLILGQNASSGESSGLSGGDAQSKVRDDIRQADCAMIESAVNAQLVKIWYKFNYTDEKMCPQFRFKAFVDSEMEKHASDLVIKRAEVALNCMNANVITPSIEIEEYLRNTLGLPEMNDAVKSYWQKNQNIRLPGANAVTPELQLSGEPNVLEQRLEFADHVMQALEENGAFDDIFDPLRTVIEDILRIEDEKKCLKKLMEAVNSPALGDDGKLQMAVQGAIYNGITAGMIKTKLNHGGEQ